METSTKSIVSKLVIGIVIFLITPTFFCACDSDNVGGNLYTFTDQMMGQYITNDTTVSEFNKLMDKTKVKGLLNAYGLFTCFIPTNEAMRNFYKEKGKKSLDEFTPDSLNQMAYDHLINGAIIMFAQFPVNGRLSSTTMSDKNIYILRDSITGVTCLNSLSTQLIAKDILVHNGVIHRVNKVMDPVRIGLAKVISNDSVFSLFYKGLVATALVDSLYRNIDESYSMTTIAAADLIAAAAGSVASDRYVPYTRRYGYTLLMESNATLKNNNITNLETMKQYAASVYDALYPEDANIKEPTNRKNSLNRFIAYHMINKRLSTDQFINAYNSPHMSGVLDLYEYIEPMCPNTLIEVKYNKLTAKSNIFNTVRETGKYIELGNRINQSAENGVYHEVNDMLVYSADVDAELSSKRLRFDFASLFPELTNNNMRGRKNDNLTLYRWALPRGYLENLICNNEQTVIAYTTPNSKLMNFEGDEFFVSVQSGKLYDFEVTTPPIPAGTYEVRFAYQANGKRGVAQFYVDGVPTGVPVNLNTVGSDPSIGYITPGTDMVADPYGFENDKMMRNGGYMKGPNSFKAVDESWYKGSSARYNGSNLRKILGTYAFQSASKHKIMVKGLSGGQFQIDFIEFVPTSAIESEDIN